MKRKILIPTDFSENALIAFKYGLKMAKLLHADITVLHVFDIPEVKGRGLHVTMEVFLKQIRKEHQAKLDNYAPTLNEVKNEEGHQDIHLDFVLEGGSIPTAIRRVVSNEKINLVVMGTQGATGVKSFFIGSKAAETLERSTVPVFIIPPYMNPFSHIETIGFATDYSEAAYKAMHWLDHITSLGKLDIFSFHINHEMDPEGAAKWKKSFDGVIKQHFDIENESFIEGVFAYEALNPSDLIALVVSKKGFFYSLFNSKHAQQVVYSKKVPVLGIPESYLLKK